MKKITKLNKILLAFAIIFSQLSGVVTVLADEITVKPLSLILEQNFDEDMLKSYNLIYKSERGDYEEYEKNGDEEIQKTYDIELTSTFTYLNNTVSDSNTEVIKDVTGKTLNTESSIYEIDSISKYYDGIFKLSVKVLDDEKVVFETELVNPVDNTLKGLKGTLNSGEIVPTSEIVTSKSVASYEVVDGKEYSQSLQIMVGELSPNSNYKVKYTENDYSEVMTGEELRNKFLVGNTLDLIGKLSGEYTNKEEVTIVEVNENDEIINTYLYSYDASIEYGTSEDNDVLFNELLQNLNIEFYNNLAVILVPELLDEETNVPTVREVRDMLTADLTLSITDARENELDLNDELVLDSELSNGCKLTFTNGSEAIYNVLVVGDANGDNHLTKEDLVETMNAFVNENKLSSMDLLYEENVEEPFDGKIDFEDIMVFNEALKENRNLENLPENNQNLYLTFGEVPAEILVGDTFELNIVLNTNNNELVNDYIDGLAGLITTDGKLELVEVKVNDKLIGSYSSNGKFVAAGSELSANGEVVLTLTLTALEEGEATVSLKDLKLAKYLNIVSFNDMIKTVEITRNISTNNNLSSLNASVGTFDKEFSSDVTVYTLTVPAGTEKVILSGALADIFSSVDGLVEYTLIDNKTVVNVTVTAEDGSQKVYTIYIIREAEKNVVAAPVVYNYSSNNYLKSLEINNHEIKFDRETTDYSITVDSNVTSLDITALAEDSSARVEITGNESFKEGKNTVVVTVTAENGSEREYTITVNKKAETSTTTEKEEKTKSNTAEKIVIIILIVLVVLGLLYLIFKKDEEDLEVINDSKPKDKTNNKQGNKINKK